MMHGQKNIKLCNSDFILSLRNKALLNA